MRSMVLTRLLLFVLVVAAFSAASFAQIGISVTIGPPELPVYQQPPCPADGYIWTPGYWAWSGDGYYWVPGTWVQAPEPGLLWTPPYWGWGGDRFIFHEGYWGPHVGFYGGIVYGFGYFGRGYEGGRWDNGRFFYNRSVTNVNITNIHNVYNTTVINNTVVNRVSYNGGRGGIDVRPTREEEAFEHERHVAPVTAQTRHVEIARANPDLRASANHGQPPIAATRRPGPVHAREIPRPEHPAAPNTGNAKLDQKYQHEQDKVFAKQEQERQKLQQRQEQDHQHLAQQHADQARMQQMEERHQQQTQQMEDKHTRQQQQLQNKMEGPGRNSPPPQR